jgi:hypothetical protein
VISTTATITNHDQSFLRCDANEIAAMYSSPYDMMAQSHTYEMMVCSFVDR